MRCIETPVPWGNAFRLMALAAAAVASLSLPGCSQRALGPAPPAAARPVPPVPAGQPRSPSVTPVTPLPPASPTLPSAALPAAPGATNTHKPLPPPTTARNWAEFRLLAARRIVAANPNGTYLGEVREPLLAIPVLEMELNVDGSLRRVDVLRHPSQARDTTQLAIDAVRRAAPFGDVSRLPKPWKFAEVFLFDDDRRFKPRTLDH